MSQTAFWHLYELAVAWVVFWALTSVAFRMAGGKPIFPRVPKDAIFSESWTSGRSRRNFWTGLGSANNCLMVAVTGDTLIVSLYFPFDLLFLPDLFDLEHRVPRTAIRSVETRKRFFFRRTIQITFETGTGAARTIELYLRNPEDFLRALSATGARKTG